MNLLELHILVMLGIGCQDPTTGLKAAHAAGEPASVLRVEDAVRVCWISDLQFSPDGSRLAFVVEGPPSGRRSPKQIHVLNVARRESRAFTTTGEENTHPRWSPDGSWLAFLSDRGGSTTIHRMPSNGGEATPLLLTNHSVSAFVWSPEGGRVAFLASVPDLELGVGGSSRSAGSPDPLVSDQPIGGSQLWLLDVETRQVNQLTRPPWRIDEVAWGRDGESIHAVGSDRPEVEGWTRRFLAVDATDGRIRTIHSPKGPVSEMRISPLGQGLTYLASREDGPIEHDLFYHSFENGSNGNLTSETIDRPIMSYD